MQESSQLTDSPNIISLPKLIYIVAISIDLDNKRDDERKEKNNDCQKKIKEKIGANLQREGFEKKARNIARKN